MLECEKGKDGNKRDVEGAVPYEVLETKNGRPMTAPTKNECSGDPLVASRKKRDVEGAVSYEILGTKKGRPMIAPPQNKTSFHKFKINNIEKSRIGNTNFGDYR